MRQLRERDLLRTHAAAPDLVYTQQVAQHARLAQHVCRTPVDDDVTDPLAVHAHAEHRAHIVTVGRLAERGGELYRADMLALYELRLLHVVRQEKGHAALEVLMPAAEHHPAEAQLRIVRQRILLRRREKARRGEAALIFAAAGKILAALQKFIVFH